MVWRHAAIDVDRFAVETVARKIGNIMLAIVFFHPSTNCIERLIYHGGRDVPLWQFKFLMGAVGWRRSSDMAVCYRAIAVRLHTAFAKGLGKTIVADQISTSEASGFDCR